MEDLEEVRRTWLIAERCCGILSQEKASELISSMRTNEKKNGIGQIWHLCLAICEKQNGTIVGWCGLDGTGRKNGPDIFYIVNETLRNRGVATQSGELLLYIAFQVYHVPVVYGGCHKQNIASCHVLQKIGLKQYSQEKDGDPLFRITAEEYMGKRCKE